MGNSTVTDRAKFLHKLLFRNCCSKSCHQASLARQQGAALLRAAELGLMGIRYGHGAGWGLPWVPWGRTDPAVMQLLILKGFKAHKLTFLESRVSKGFLTTYSITSCQFLFSASKTISEMDNEKQYIKSKTKSKTNDHKWLCQETRSCII